MDQAKRARGEGGGGAPPADSGMLQLNRRKDFGNTGHSIRLLANSFLLKIDFSRIHQYSLVFEPEVDSFMARRKLLGKEYLKDEAFSLAGDILWMKKKLSAEEFTCTHPETQVKYRVRIKYVKTLGKDDLKEQFFLYNNTFKKLMKECGLKEMGRSLYDPTRPVALQDFALQFFPGFTTGITKSLAGITMNIDIAHKVVHTDNILKIMSNNRADRRTLTDELVGAIVYVRLNHRTHRIDDIDWEKSPRDTFKRRRKGDQQEVEMSIAQYYEETYAAKISDMRQPLLVATIKRRQPGSRVKTRETIYLVPELCYRTGLPDSMLSNFHLMKGVHNHTRVDPNERVNGIESFIQDKFINTKNERIRKELDKWGMSFPPRVMEIPGRCFPAEELFMGGDQKVISDDKAAWDMRYNAFLGPMTVGEWLVVAERRDENPTMEFLDTLKQLHGNMGMVFSQPPVVEIVDRFEHLLAALETQVKPTVTLVVVVLTHKNKEKYNKVKEIMTTIRPVPTQCLVSKTISDGKKLKSVCTKVIQQINSKLGGELWRLDTSAFANMGGKVMIVGIDVAHDKGRGRKSFVGFCATTNKHFTKYYCRVNEQPRREQEIITTPRLLIKEALLSFYKNAGGPPDSIIVYRDGVGDSQLNGVLQNEVTEFLAQFDEMKFKPKFTYIVVQKKTTARFFQTGSGKLSNPRPGTVIDKDITSADFNDFYMVNQYVNQGSVSPTRYIIVHDSSNFGPDNIQRLTFKLAHLYFNWPGTIAVPAPVKYAHKLCHLVSQATHKEFHKALNEKLFFL